MWIKAAPLRQMRAMLRAQLPPRAFLKRDRGEAMFVSNAPVFDPSLAQIAGFAVQRRGMLLHISPDAGWIARFERRFKDPPDYFSGTLKRFAGQRPDENALKLFIRGAKLLDAGSSADAASLAEYDRAVRRHAALALRGEGGGGSYALAVLNCILQSPEMYD